MKNNNLFFLSIIISTCFLGEAKRFPVTLRNESENIYTRKELLGRILKWNTFSAATCGGITYGFSSMISELNKEVMLTISAIGGLMAGAIAWRCSQTPESVYIKATITSEGYQKLLNGIQENDDANILGFIKQYYIEYRLPLLVSFNDLNIFLYNFNLYVDMMENTRILNSLNPEQRAKYLKLVPVAEMHMESLMKAILIIKALPEFGKEIANEARNRAADAAASAAFSASLQAMKPGR